MLACIIGILLDVNSVKPESVHCLATILNRLDTMRANIGKKPSNAKIFTQSWLRLLPSFITVWLQLPQLNLITFEHFYSLRLAQLRNSSSSTTLMCSDSAFYAPNLVNKAFLVMWTTFSCTQQFISQKLLRDWKGGTESVAPIGIQRFVK